MSEDDFVEDGAVDDYAAMLKSHISGLNMLIDTLKGNSADGIETTPEEQRQAWEDGKEAARQRVSPLSNPYRTTDEGRHLLPQLWRSGWWSVREGDLT